MPRPRTFILGTQVYVFGISMSSSYIKVISTCVANVIQSNAIEQILITFYFRRAIEIIRTMCTQCAGYVIRLLTSINDDVFSAFKRLRYLAFRHFHKLCIASLGEQNTQLLHPYDFLKLHSSSTYQCWVVLPILRHVKIVKKYRGIRCTMTILPLLIILIIIKLYWTVEQTATV